MKFKIFRITPYKEIKQIVYNPEMEPIYDFPYLLWEPSLEEDNLFNSYEDAVNYLNQWEKYLYNHECVILPYWKSEVKEYG